MYWKLGVLEMHCGEGVMWMPEQIMGLTLIGMANSLS